MQVRENNRRVQTACIQIKY